jgi:anti-sigma factor RsiW
VPQQDQHLTTELLSSLLDKQLTPEEQAYCDAHLEECEQCQDVLDNLQQTVNLLQSLPQLEVPRSFALPVDFKITQSTSDGNRQQPVERSIATSLSRLPMPLRRTLRTVSALAAVVGLFLALSGFVTILQPSASMSTVPAVSDSAKSNSASQSQQAPQATSHMTTGSENNPESPTTPNKVANKQHAPSAETHTSLDFTQPEARLSIGIPLAILGGTGFIFFAQRQKHRIQPVKKPSS